MSQTTALETTPFDRDMCGEVAVNTNNKRWLVILPVAIVSVSGLQQRLEELEICQAVPEAGSLFLSTDAVATTVNEPLADRGMTR